MLFNLCANWDETRGAVFNKTNTNLLQYAIQLVCVLKWNKRGSFQKKSQIDDNMLLNSWANWDETRGAVFNEKNTLSYYSMLFNSCAYWNETRGVVFKKKSNWWQYAAELVSEKKLMCEMKQEGQFTKNNNLLLYAIQLVCVLKWNKRDSF